MASFSVLTTFWIIKTSQAKERSKERVKKTEDSSYSLPSHFWSTSWSPFSTCYIPFQISGSKNPTLLTVYNLKLKWGIYGLWKTTAPGLCEIRTTPSVVRTLCETRTTPLIVRSLCKTRATLVQHSHSPCVFGVKSPLFCWLHMRSFLMYFWCKFLSYPCN